MNISYKWLKEYVDFDLTPQEVCDALTSTGLEVDALEEVQTIKGGLKGLYVGQVLTCDVHPNSDHLHVTTVDLGRETPSQIVCGAPNVAAGQKVIVADLGCVLYDGDKEFVIKKSKLRGVESCGMICAEDEIGIGTDHAGIIVLPEDAKVGTPAAEYYNLESDWLIEVDITANRADALSHWGVARDLYAWLVANGKQTAGQGAARNNGINNSKSPYITFIDADDYVDCEYLNILYKDLKKNNVDISICDIVKVKKDQEEYYDNYNNLLGSKIKNYMISHPGPVARLYKKELLK